MHAAPSAPAGRKLARGMVARPALDVAQADCFIHGDGRSYSDRKMRDHAGNA